jgi:aminodeoxyfutalosine deaminase
LSESTGHFRRPREQSPHGLTTAPQTAPWPKIELHVHLEGAIRAETLLTIARRNGEKLPADTVEGVRELYRFCDFDHFIEIWILTTNCLRTADDFREIVVAYAAEAKQHGAVYLEAIFSPIERTWRGVGWDEIFTGYCDGAQEARELHGVEVRLTPDITRGASLEDGFELVRRAARFRDRGVVAVGLGGEEALYPPERFAPVFREARELGLGSVPHAGEVVGPPSIRAAIDSLAPDRIRHGIRAVEDPELVAELADRGLVLDVTPVSNIRTGAVASLEEHPLPRLASAGVRCSISTDDPAMFDTDLSHEYDVARTLGVEPRAAFEAGVTGALCDDTTLVSLREIGDDFDWAQIASEAAEVDSIVSDRSFPTEVRAKPVPPETAPASGA